MATQNAPAQFKTVVVLSFCLLIPCGNLGTVSSDIILVFPRDFTNLKFDMKRPDINFDSNENF